MAEQSGLKNWVLVCQGGGGKGAWEAGFIHEVVNGFGLDFKTCIGTSVGALNCALYLQSCTSHLWKDILLESWSKMSSCEILGLPSLKGVGRFGLSGGSKLHDLVVQKIRKSDMESVCTSQSKYLVILATNCDNWRTWVWHPFLFGPHTATKASRDSFSNLHAALIASASIPIIYPYIQQDMMTLYDGGLVENNPLNYAEVGCSNVLVLSPNQAENGDNLCKRIYKYFNPLHFLENQVLRRVLDVKRDISYRRAQSAEMCGVIPVTKYYFARPSERLPSGTLFFSEKSSKESFELGQKDGKDFMRALLSNSANLASKYDLEILNFALPSKNIFEWFFSKVLKVRTISG